MKKLAAGAVSALAVAMIVPAHAQPARTPSGNLQKLSGFQQTGTPLEIPTVPQGGAKAEAIQKDLQHIKLPPGFKISLYAIVPEFFYESPDVAAFVVVPQGKLIPPQEESFNHTSRVCRIGPDDKLYITLGQPFNVYAPGKLELYKRIGMGGIIRMDRDGKNREVFATGVRNSVGMDFNPKDNTLWFTDNQVDGMGDDKPVGEINRADRPGLNFGFPYYGGGKTRTTEYQDKEPPADAVFPQVEEVAHAADLGMIFYTGSMFPAQYRGGIFSAQHGSWNRTKPVGARIMFTSLKPDGTADKSEPFAEGWLTDNGEYLGRPVDVAQLPDGSLLVSGDLVGALYRISYEGH